jgi:hypothetical protein
VDDGSWERLRNRKLIAGLGDDAGRERWMLVLKMFLGEVDDSWTLLTRLGQSVVVDPNEHAQSWSSHPGLAVPDSDD